MARPQCCCNQREGHARLDRQLIGYRVCLVLVSRHMLGHLEGVLRPTSGGGDGRGGEQQTRADQHAAPLHHPFPKAHDGTSPFL